MCLFPGKKLDLIRVECGTITGFEYQVVAQPGRMSPRYFCGYVRVTPGHPWFGKAFRDVRVDVHGGLTYARHGVSCATHGSEPEWWLGFDTADGVAFSESEAVAETFALVRAARAAQEEAHGKNV